MDVTAQAHTGKASHQGHAAVDAAAGGASGKRGRRKLSCRGIIGGRLASSKGWETPSPSADDIPQLNHTHK